MIFIRECGHSDEDTRKTNHPERCYYCWLEEREKNELLREV